MELKINDSVVSLDHRVKHENEHTIIDITAECDGIKVSHRMTIGCVDDSLPPEYGSSHLQNDLDAARKRLASLVESKARARKLSKLVN